MPSCCTNKELSIIWALFIYFVVELAHNTVKYPCPGHQQLIGLTEIAELVSIACVKISHFVFIALV
jgi:hypothetical protein